jgi:hypothetical protein
MARQIGPGNGEQSATLLDTVFRMASYRPTSCAPPLARGRNTFTLAESIVCEHKWPCSWKKLEVPNVGHDFSDMLESRQAIEA